MAQDSAAPGLWFVLTYGRLLFDDPRRHRRVLLTKRRAPGLHEYGGGRFDPEKRSI